MGTIFSYRMLELEGFTDVSHLGSGGISLLNERQLSKSALRALDLLEFFAKRKEPARAAEVARSLGMSHSSADQLLKTLASRAYLIFDFSSKLYWPSPRLLGFATTLEKSYFGGNRLQMLAQHLLEQTDCCVSICTPVGRVMQLIHFVAPPGKSYARQPGHLFPMFSSAAGAAILAAWPLATVRALIAEAGDQLGALTTRPDIVLARLSDIREMQHAFGGLSEDADKCSIAVALPRSGHNAELTLSLRGSIADLRSRRWRFAALIHESIASFLGNERECRCQDHASQEA
jgi:DNA-binding IclR family transcriptional regulator